MYLGKKIPNGTVFRLAKKPCPYSLFSVNADSVTVKTEQRGNAAKGRCPLLAACPFAGGNNNPSQTVR